MTPTMKTPTSPRGGPPLDPNVVAYLAYAVTLIIGVTYFALR